MITIQKCINPACRLRFTALEGEPFASRCPRCRSDTRLISRDHQPLDPPIVPIPGPFDVRVVIDNVRSALNVGSIFRTADGVGVSHIYCCGITSTPDMAEVRKTSLGSEQWVRWDFSPDAFETCEALIAEGFKLWALEGGREAHPYYGAQIKPGMKIGIILGSERTGVDPEILSLCEKRLFLPMVGQKKSLNVAVAFGAAIYGLIYGSQIP